MNNHLLTVTHMPTPLPDEHILSVLVRCSLLSDRNNFSASVANVSHDTNGLTLQSAWRQIYDDIIIQFGEGSTYEKIFKNHTLMPYYSPFNHSQTENLSNNQTCLGGLIRPSFQNIIKAANHWRWCPLCTEEDLVKYGTTYWHVNHQIPTVQRCLKHKVSLINLCTKCHFQQKEISVGLPPENKKCPQCEYAYRPTPHETEELHLWLEKMSIAFFKYETPTTINSIRQLLRKQIGFDNFSSSRSVTQRKRVLDLQNAFISWLPDNILSDFFLNQSRMSIEKHTAFRLSTASFKQINLPPLCYLLMLAFFKINNGINFYGKNIQDGDITEQILL